MKVLFTMDALINAGTEKSVLDIISHFSSDTEVIVAYFYPRHDLKEAYEKAGIPLFFLDLQGKRSFFTGIRKLKKLIRSEKPDVVVSSILRANLISRRACKATNTKLIGTFVSDSYSEQRESSFSFKRKIGARIFYSLDKWTSGIPIAWISNSNSIRESNCKALGVPPEIVKVIYRGRNSKKFQPHPALLHGRVFRFCFLGRLLQTKGLAELADAFKKVSENHAAVSLDIYGEGPFRKTLSKHISEIGMEDKIILHGAVFNGWEKLYDADCFVFPSWYEGFSGSLVEAMMVGIPIIASNIPMNLEAVEDRSTAVIFKVNNVDDLADKMLNMINDYDKLKLLGNKARSEAINRFDIQNIAEEYESFIAGIAGSSNDVKKKELKSIQSV